MLYADDLYSIFVVVGTCGLVLHKLQPTLRVLAFAQATKVF